MGDQTWKPLPHPIVIDSGASETVLPTSWCSEHNIKESHGSKNGVTYTAANGEVIMNDGEKTLMIATRDTWQTRLMTLPPTPPRPPTDSVSHHLHHASLEVH